jgi:hypothetical protein
MAAYVLTDRAVIEALREATAHGVKVRIWRDASEAARLGEFDVEAQLGGRGLEIRSNAVGGELMHLKGYCVDHRLLRLRPPGLRQCQGHHLVQRPGPGIIGRSS